jgi:hypothetical protein
VVELPKETEPNLNQTTNTDEERQDTNMNDTIDAVNATYDYIDTAL